jgi:hypothetical protein
MRKKQMKRVEGGRHAVVFTLEALVTLTAALLLLSFASVQREDANWDSVQRSALARDLLETSVKQRETAQALYAFAEGSDAAGEEIKERWNALLDGTSAECFELKAGKRKVGGECSGTTAFAATASAPLYDGKRFTEATLTLYFAG